MYGNETSQFMGIFLKLIFALAGGLAIGFFLKFVFGGFKKSTSGKIPRNTERQDYPQKSDEGNQIEEITIKYAKRGSKEDKKQEEIDEYHV